MVMLRNCEESKSDKGIEYSEELNCFYFPPSPTYFPLLPTTLPPSPSYFPLYSPPSPPRASSSNSSAYGWNAILLGYHLPKQQHEDIVHLRRLTVEFGLFAEYTIQDRGGALDVILGGRLIRINGFEQQQEDIVHPAASGELVWLVEGRDDVDGFRKLRHVPGQQDEIVDESVDPGPDLMEVQQYTIECRNGAVRMFQRRGALTMNGWGVSDGEGLSTTPEPSPIFQTTLSIRVWQGHCGKWGVEFRFGWNWLNIGTFKIEGAALANEWVIRRKGGKDHIDFPLPDLFLNKNREESTTARITEIPTIDGVATNSTTREPR